METTTYTCSGVTGGFLPFELPRSVCTQPGEASAVEPLVRVIKALVRKQSTRMNRNVDALVAVLYGKTLREHVECGLTDAI